MENIIYYFSGTGNSLRTAVRIAEGIGGAEIVSVRCDPERVSAENADMIGFVCPAYEWEDCVCRKNERGIIIRLSVRLI